MLLSPFTTLYQWVAENLGSEVVRFVWVDPKLGTTTHRCAACEHPTFDRPDDWLLDCRHLPTRALLLRALAPIYAARHLPDPSQWALGEGFGSDLTAEQAGRVVAEMVRRVGILPEWAGAMLPRRVLGTWAHAPADPLWTWRRNRVAPRGRLGDGTAEVYVNDRGWSAAASRGIETGAEGRAVGDRIAQADGSLLWEEITPCL